MVYDTAAGNKVDELFQIKGLRLHRGKLFDCPASPKPPEFDFGRVEGMLLGVAIGDALGITSEGKLPERRRELHGEIRHYIRNKYTPELRGFPSDDTQLTFWTLEQLIADKGLVPDHLASRFANGGRIFGLGATVKEFLINYKSGKPWHEAGPESAGNGSLMRISPMILPHLRSQGTDLWANTACAAMITHNDYAAISACVAFVAMLWELMDMTSPPDPMWWVDRYVELARDLEGDTIYTPRGGRFSDYIGPLWRFVQEYVPMAYSKKMPVVEACNEWYSGAFLLETVPSVLYILARHAPDPEEAIVRAVNDTKDNDSIASIVGAAVGALHGREALPRRWIDDLSGRTSLDDDGKVFKLIDEAAKVFWIGRS